MDSHRIFRFVQGRDSFWRKHHLLTGEATPQWKQVLEDCNVKVTYALSPQAKGKMERPYAWLQDRLIRTCVREDITEIKQAQRVLTMNSTDIITNKSTLPPKKSLICDSKKP